MANLIAHLVTQGIVGFLTMDTAVQHMHKVGGRLSSSILETTDIEPQVLLESISEFYSLEYAPDSLLLSIDPDVPQFWRHDNALRLGAIPLALDATGLTLGVLEPLSKIQLDEVKEEYGSNIRQMLLLEFRFFELCNRFFDVVLEHRYAIWASKFPLKDETETGGGQGAAEAEALSPDAAISDVGDALQAHHESAQHKRTTETTEPVEDYTIETEQTDADEPDTLTPPTDDASHILTGTRVPSSLLGDDKSFEAVFAASDDALLLPDHDISSLFEPVSDEPASEPEVATSPPSAPKRSDRVAEEAAQSTPRGKEPSMPSIRVSSPDSQSTINPALSRHTPSRIESVDGDDDYRGREPFPAAHGATQLSGAFRIEPTKRRSGLHPLGATHTIAQQLGLADEQRSWRTTNASMDALSAEASASSQRISSDELRDIFKHNENVEELLNATLTYFGAFFERRFFMHFWQPNRSTGLLMQGVSNQQTPFTRVEVPYDESSGVHKMRNTGNYLQGSPIDIGFLTLYTRLGIPTAKEAIAMPVHVNNEVVMTLIIDNGPDRHVGESLPAGDVALMLHELGQALTALARRPHRTATPTPFEGEAATGTTPNEDEEPLVPVDLFKDITLPPAPSDDLEIEMDSMQMDPVDVDEEDHRTLDSIDRIFGRGFDGAQTSDASDTHTTQGSDSFEIAIGTDQELSPAAKALLEQDTRRSDQRAVSIIVGDDERSDADLAYDLIPPTPSDLIRPADYPARTKPATSKKSEDKVSRTTARHHALSGHKAFHTPTPGEKKTPETPPHSKDTPQKRATKSRWAAQDLARLLRVGSSEFAATDVSSTTGPATQTTRTLQDTAEQEAASKLQDTAEQEADGALEDTAEQEADGALEDTAQQEADSTLEDTQENDAADKREDTAEQDTDAAVLDTAEQGVEDTPEPSNDVPESDDAAAGPQTTADDTRDTAASQTHDDQLAATEEEQSVEDTEQTEQETAVEQEANEKRTEPEDIEAKDTFAAEEEEEEDREDTAERLRAILQERKAAKSQERPPLETPIHSPPTDTHTPAEATSQDAAGPDEKPSETQSATHDATTDDVEPTPHDDAEDDSDDEKTLMFSPDMAAADRAQTSAPIDETPAEANAETTEDASLKSATHDTDDVDAPAAPKAQSKEIDLDAVLGEVDQSPVSDDVDKLARELSTELSGTAEQSTASSKASLVRLAELTEQQRRMGTTALRPLSLPMETLLRGAESAREDALKELLKLPANQLPDIHSEFPGPLHVDRTDPEQAQLPLAQHGPLLALVDARLYDFVPQMWSCLERKSADARYYALRFLSLIRNLERRFVLVERALDEDPQIRELALRYIDNFRNSPDFLIALETFRDRLEDPSADIRIAAADALVKLQDHDSIPLLIQALEDSDADVQAKAHQGLTRLTFIDCGETPEAWEKWRAVHGRDVPEQWLVDAMDAIEPVRRALAARALEHISDLTVNYHPEMSKQGLMRAKMTVERHFGLRR